LDLRQNRAKGLGQSQLKEKFWCTAQQPSTTHTPVYILSDGGAMNSPAIGHSFNWSPQEKRVARKAFDRAYRGQCAAISAKVKQMVSKASSPSDLWKIHDYLSGQRTKTDAIYDYRYSVLLSVFGRLLSEGWLQDADLDGLREDKIAEIRRWTD
jgi:hypothetical protein